MKANHAGNEAQTSPMEAQARAQTRTTRTESQLKNHQTSVCHFDQRRHILTANLLTGPTKSTHMSRAIVNVTLYGTKLHTESKTNHRKHTTRHRSHHIAKIGEFGLCCLIIWVLRSLASSHRLHLRKCKHGTACARWLLVAQHSTTASHMTGRTFFLISCITPPLDASRL